MNKQSANCCAIVVSFNGIKWIEKCIQSLRDSDVDVIVVDNGSEDGTLQFLENADDVELIQTDQNLGFGKANNLGIEIAYKRGYEYYFLLNQDAWVDKYALGDLLQFLCEHEEFGILSPVHYDGDGINLDQGFDRYVRLRNSSGFYLDHKRQSVKKKIYEVSFVNAAAWLVSRDCLTEVGLFHPLFEHYGEDDNYVHRVKAAGFKVGVLGATKLYHDRASRFKKRINKNAKFRSMVMMVHLNPLKQRNKFILWLISMGNLLSIPSFWYFLPNLHFYLWGMGKYFQYAREVHNYSKSFNPLIEP